MFERFRRGSRGMTGPAGHGLGLPIARELAREWGGDVRIEGRDGGGTAAILALRPDAATDRPHGGRRLCRRLTLSVSTVRSR